MVERVAVVGAGLAGAKTVEALRDGGYDGGVLLLGSETWRPYERPPLSKTYLAGQSRRAEAFVHDEGWYAAHDVDLRLGTTVRALDPHAGAVVDDTGAAHPVDAVVLATGSQPRTVRVPGTELDGVTSLRTLDDADRLRRRLVPGTRVVVVGGGWIGTEVAAVAAQAGCEVTLLVREAHPLLRVLGPRLAERVARLHRGHGVDVRGHARLSAIHHAGSTNRVGAVELADGTLEMADVVVLAVGANPRTGLARAAGIEVEDGVVTDAWLRSSLPQVLAVGDIASADHPFLGRHVRVEHWDTALHQGETAAATLLGRSVPYQRLPYFFTDQFELSMEYAGHVGPGGFDELVVRGDLEALRFVAFWLRGGRVLAGMNVNVWDVVDDVIELIRSRAEVDPRRLADPTVRLAEVVAPAGEGARA